MCTSCQLKYFFLVQVMALIAYLMEFKGNYGPHLIIVPNAVLVNWKVSFNPLISTIFLFFVIKCAFNPKVSLTLQSELHTWLPSVSCIFYVGTKDHRSKLFSQVSVPQPIDV
jgi:SWI/SNF-related matrix-associated actin-dependent regulator of chromatin subfamily A protein 2/4